ncbi:hypothetical protein [Aureivirga sp. CE67]|uniref:hypothetical protein n=1 Tax=Aureivirga sp. CE67 TaxID=1788983 RepID=UPI0018CA3D02|nr:hypothetical protein [Aureivirga sp. CE67]
MKKTRKIELKNIEKVKEKDISDFEHVSLEFGFDVNHSILCISGKDEIDISTRLTNI